METINIRIPYLSTVWATGSFESEHSNPNWIMPGRKSTRLPAPFYKHKTATFEIETITGNNVVFDVESDRKITRFCLTEEGDFYRKEIGSLNPEFSGDKTINTIQAISLMERNNIFLDEQVLYSPSTHHELPKTILHHTQTVTPENIHPHSRYRPAGFLASVEDLSANAIIHDETDDRVQVLEECLQGWVYHDGDFWEKGREPLLIKAVSPHRTENRLIFGKWSANLLFSFLTGHLFSFFPLAGGFHSMKNKIQHFVENWSDDGLGLEIMSVWQSDKVSYVKGDESLLRKTDERDLTKRIINMLVQCEFDYRMTAKFGPDFTCEHAAEPGGPR